MNRVVFVPFPRSVFFSLSSLYSADGWSGARSPHASPPTSGSCLPPPQGNSAPTFASSVVGGGATERGRRLPGVQPWLSGGPSPLLFNPKRRFGFKWWSGVRLNCKIILETGHVRFAYISSLFASTLYFSGFTPNSINFAMMIIGTIFILIYLSWYYCSQQHHSSRGPW